MRVERAVVRELDVELRAAFATARGSTRKRRVLLVTLEAEGLESWSECVAGVDETSTESVDRAWSVLTECLLPGAPGRRFDEPAELLRSSGAPADAPAAAAAVEMAAWALAARSRGVSLARELGADRDGVRGSIRDGVRDVVPVGVAVGLHDTEASLLDAVAGYVADGYARIKVKITPGRDVEILQAVRKRFPAVDLWADANASYTLGDVDRLRRLDDLDLGLIEQPLAAGDLDGHARLQELIRTPICLDESIRSLQDVDHALDIGACRIVNLKPGRVGGLVQSLRIHDRLHERGIPLWCGGMLETGIGRAYNLALASLPGFTLPGDLSASRRYWERDLVSPEHEIVGGCMRVPRGPGIGVDVDVERVEALTVRAAVFGS